MNGRRGFMKCLVGAFVASAIEIRLAAAPVVEMVSPSPVAPTSVLTNEMLDRIHAQLQEAASTAWMQRHKEAYNALAKDCRKPEFEVYLSI